MTELIDLSIVEAQRQIRRRGISAAELVEANLRQIERTESTVRAYVQVFAEEAREAAQQLDRELAGGHWRGLLHGIPLAVKDLFYMKGTPTAAGSEALREFVPAHDATVVRRLREVGAILIGKTVTHELAYGVNVPATRSPWGTDSYPGGSSAGSGAAVAARSAFGAMGTDTGGSIREPAALNGIVGLKPTFGVVSRYGVVPLSPSLDHAGPLVRTVEDCALVLQAIAGYDPLDSGSSNRTVPDYTASLDQGVQGLTIGVEREFYFSDRVWRDVRHAVDGVLNELAEQGARIVEVHLPELDKMSPVGVTIFLVEGSAYNRDVLRDAGGALDPETRVMLELGELVPATHYMLAQRARTVLKAAMKNLFQAHQLDALIVPTLPTTTMPIGQVMEPDESGEAPLSAAIHYMIPANVTGQPALTAPCGFSDAGLPIGYQLIGRPFDEPTLFRLARAYERNHDWERRRPPVVSEGVES